MYRKLSNAPYLLRPVVALLFSAGLACGHAQADQTFPVTLAGHAFLPAKTFVAPPKDAPKSLAVSGKYTGPGGKRVDAVGSLPGTSFLSDKDAPRQTGISLPFAGQPVQGFSGIKKAKDGTYWVLQDNGYGSKANSSDAMLIFHRVKPDWKKGSVSLVESLFLHDPDGKLPFTVVNEGTKSRYLTGMDLDIESIQPIGENFWFGDELGPYLVKTDRKGKVLAFFETQVDGKVIKSPDHYAVTTPAVPGQFSTPVRRSRGFEGMAAAKDGSKLYPLLEGPLWNAEEKKWEQKGDREYLRILEFDTVKNEWTGRSWKYLLEQNGNNIGDFT